MSHRFSFAILVAFALLMLAALGGDVMAAGKSKKPHTLSVSLETITNDAATGDGGNVWGGHQTRIVRTNQGVFAADLTAGNGYKRKQWNLARRTARGTWRVIAQGNAGREPVNLLAAPDGTLYVIGFPRGTAKMWSGKPTRRSIEMSVQTIPGMPQGFWPYVSAGIDAQGNLCALASDGDAPGGLHLACFHPNTETWTTRSYATDYRFGYTYVFPQGDSVSLVNTRDVTWGALGYTQPPNTFDYVFNAFRYWHTDDVGNASLQARDFLEQPPTTEFAAPFLNAQPDAYLDTHGNMHIMYVRNGADTNGVWQFRHRVVDANGTVLHDVLLPEAMGWYNRIFQDANENFYILGSYGKLYPAGADGVTLQTPIDLDLQGHEVEYSGFLISAPRTGTGLSNTLDVVFPSGDEHLWLYFKLDLTQLQ